MNQSSSLSAAQKPQPIKTFIHPLSPSAPWPFPVPAPLRSGTILAGEGGGSMDGTNFNFRPDLPLRSQNLDRSFWLGYSPGENSVKRNNLWIDPNIGPESGSNSVDLDQGQRSLGMADRFLKGNRALGEEQGAMANSIDQVTTMMMMELGNGQGISNPGSTAENYDPYLSLNHIPSASSPSSPASSTVLLPPQIQPFTSNQSIPSLDDALHEISVFESQLTAHEDKEDKEDAEVENNRGSTKVHRKVGRPPLKSTLGKDTTRTNHVCDECGKKFRLKSGLKQHRMTHQSKEDRKFSCSIEGCRKRFTTSSNARRHFKIHCHHRSNPNNTDNDLKNSSSSPSIASPIASSSSVPAP